MVSLKSLVNNKRISVGVTGASGAIYALTLLKHLHHSYDEIYLMITEAARVVFATEVDLALPRSSQKIEALLCETMGCEQGKLKVFAKDNWFSPAASGSAAPKQMVICPASMGCVSAIAAGASNNLLERAADVVIKEKGQLIVVPREMPFSTIHLKNLLTLSEAGVTVMPAAPGFYNQPQSVDDVAEFVVARILSHLGVDTQINKPWGYA